MTNNFLTYLIAKSDVVMIKKKNYDTYSYQYL